MEARALCAASISQCYTATYYGNDECIRPCVCMGDNKYKDSTLRIPVEQSIDLCINRFWLDGGKGIILIGSPRLHMYSWCQACAADAS